jgi:hypothetical protein
LLANGSIIFRNAGYGASKSAVRMACPMPGPKPSHAPQRGFTAGVAIVIAIVGPAENHCFPEPRWDEIVHTCKKVDTNVPFGSMSCFRILASDATKAPNFTMSGS